MVMGTVRVFSAGGHAPTLMGWMCELHAAAVAEGGDWPACPPQVDAFTAEFLGAA